MSALTSAQLAQLDWAFHNPTATHRQADFYRLLAHFGEVNGDADPASILWLLGAAEVNENSGSRSAFIRDYNKAQYEVRYGGSLTDAKMDAVSNEIALQVFNEVVATGSIPIVEVLAQKDAEPAANELFNGDAGGWAGNNLFLALGYSEAFRDNIIEAGSSTYDAIAMMKFTAENFSWSNGVDVGLQFGSYPAGAATVVAATNALDAFLIAAYGANALMTASQIVASYETILGRIVEADQLHGTEDADLIHGGGGDDTIYGSDGGDLIDGAEGRDVVDYSLVDWGNRFILKGDVQSSAGYVGSVVSTGLFPNDATALFGVEEIRAGDTDDEVQLMGLPASLERIDGGDQGELGDLLSAFYASQGISFHMEGGLLAIGEATLEAVGFERVEGSGHNDVQL